MEDRPGSRTRDKSRVGPHVAYELFRHLVCPLIIGDVAQDEPAKRDQIDETNSTVNGGTTEPDVPFQTIDLRTKIQQRPVLRAPRHKRRTNRVNTRATICFELRLCAGNNKHMFVARCMFVNVIDLFMEISLHPAAYRRIKLGQVADLHDIFVIPSEVEESLMSFFARSGI